MVFVAARGRCGDHRLERIPAVAPIGMHVKVAAKIDRGNEFRNLPSQSEIDFVETAAQFRRNILHSQGRVDACLIGAGDYFTGFEVEDAVLTDAQASANGVLAQLDVMLARAGKMLQQISVKMIRQYAKV